MAATIALTHHERFDGSGYPQGLSGEEIPLEGRIVAVADVFDALLSDRCYRPAMTTEQATELIEEESGTHFDPDVVKALIGNLERGARPTRLSSRSSSSGASSASSPTGSPTTLETLPSIRSTRVEPSVWIA